MYKHGYILSKHNLCFTINYDWWDSVLSFKWTLQRIINSSDPWCEGRIYCQVPNVEGTFQSNPALFPPLCVLLMFSQNRIPHFLNVSFRNSLPSRGIYFVSFGKILSLLEIGLLEDTNYQSACIDHRWGYCISVSPWAQEKKWNGKLQHRRWWCPSFYPNILSFLDFMQYPGSTLLYIWSRVPVF